MDGFSDNPSAMTGGRRWWRATKAHPAYRELSKNGRMMAMLVALRVSQGNDWCAYDDDAMAEDLGMDTDCQGRCRPGRRGMAELSEAGFLESAEAFGRWFLSSPTGPVKRSETCNVGPKLVQGLDQNWSNLDQNWSNLDQNWSNPGPKLVQSGPKLVRPIRKMVTNGNSDGNSMERVRRETIDRLVEIFGGYMRGSSSAQRAIGVAVFAIRDAGKADDPEAWLIERAEAYIAATDPKYILKLENWLDAGGYNANPERPQPKAAGTLDWINDVQIGGAS